MTDDELTRLHARWREERRTILKGVGLALMLGGLGLTVYHGAFVLMLIGRAGAPTKPA